jgi:hypothetical protein
MMGFCGFCFLTGTMIFTNSEELKALPQNEMHVCKEMTGLTFGNFRPIIGDLGFTWPLLPNFPPHSRSTLTDIKPETVCLVSCLSAKCSQQECTQQTTSDRSNGFDPRNLNNEPNLPYRRTIALRRREMAGLGDLLTIRQVRCFRI